MRWAILFTGCMGLGCVTGAFAAVKAADSSKTNNTGMIEFILQPGDIRCIVPYITQGYATEPASPTKKSTKAGQKQGPSAPPNIELKESYSIVINLMPSVGRNLSTLTQPNIGKMIGIYFQPTDLKDVPGKNRLMRIAYARIQAPLSSSFTITGLSKQQYSYLREKSNLKNCSSAISGEAQPSASENSADNVPSSL